MGKRLVAVGLATQGSVRRIDIIAIKNNSAYILGPTIRFETHADQPHEVDSERNGSMNQQPRSTKINIAAHIDVIGLMGVSTPLSIPSSHAIKIWVRNLQETGSALKKKPPGKKRAPNGREPNVNASRYVIMIQIFQVNIVQNGTIKIGDLSFEEVEKFKYLGATVTNINDTWEEIKRRINMGNVCYYSVEKLLSSSLLSKNLKVRIYKTVILPVILYGCETWTLTLREEQRLRVFENKVLRKIFVAKRDEVTGEWRKLHNAELHALYSSPDIIMNIKTRLDRCRLEFPSSSVVERWYVKPKVPGHVARNDESRNAYRVLVGRPEGNRPLGRSRRRWEDNIKMDLREVEYDGRDWINVAQDRDQWRAYVKAAMNLRIP
ncbi:hypothetical protein ANN_05042 [Periplaneta americana]|uniref:Uncharacterized protein n=1 Tax=Periplaneta americana TaxID=6978 RepID=A0ABQ8TBP4_PERAM|nr:hypothetical protein ANN_05042 [Periplaneta americana]